MFEDKLTPHCGLDELALSSSLEQQAQSIIRFGEKRREEIRMNQIALDNVILYKIRSNDISFCIMMESRESEVQGLRLLGSCVGIIRYFYFYFIFK